MRFSLFIVILCLACSIIHAQQIKPQAVTTSGAVMNQGNANINFTVGEISVKTVTDGGNSIGQGFTNSATDNIITAIDEPDATRIRINVYPNPASKLVYIDISSEKYSFVNIVINELSGRLISKDVYSARNNHIGINTNGWQQGVYFLAVEADGNKLAVYKIVKQ